MTNNDALVVPYFKNVAVEDKNASKLAGRPIFKDMEVVEIRIAGDRNYAPVMPAHSMWRRIDDEPVSYAQRWPEQYARFKAHEEQVASGTPLSELPFLTEAKRQELRGLKVYTAEALAALDGKNLASLGINGREMKEQAAAYLAKAGGAARDVAMAAEIATLRAELDAMRRGTPAEVAEPDDAADDEKEKLKVEIAGMTGQRPRGNPSVETLRDALRELKAV